MTQQLWTDLDDMCHAIEHTPETVDLNQVRSLLRRSQWYIDQVTTSLSEATITLPGGKLTPLFDLSVTPLSQ